MSYGCHLSLCLQIKEQRGKWELATATSTSASHQQVSGISSFPGKTSPLCKPIWRSSRYLQPAFGHKQERSCHAVPKRLPRLSRPRAFSRQTDGSDCIEQGTAHHSADKNARFSPPFLSEAAESLPGALPGSQIYPPTPFCITSLSHIVCVVTCCKSVLLHRCHKNCIYLLLLRILFGKSMVTWPGNASSDLFSFSMEKCKCRKRSMMRKSSCSFSLL